jgi:hypothetical protein
MNTRQRGYPSSQLGISSPSDESLDLFGKDFLAETDEMTRFKKVAEVEMARKERAAILLAKIAVQLLRRQKNDE